MWRGVDRVILERAKEHHCYLGLGFTRPADESQALCDGREKGDRNEADHCKLSQVEDVTRRKETNAIDPLTP